jgi:hypothetical protein|nr:MAG TPA: hypothetical protein [Caudoviricetes sp.]
MTSKKEVLIGTFVNKHKILSFIEKVKNLTKMNTDKIYVFIIEGNSNEYLVTFKSYNNKGLINKLYNSTVLHVKNGCLFSINALNELIKEEKGDTIQNHKDYLIDWSKFKNKLMIMTSGKLRLYNISKIEDITVFLNS